MSKRPAKPARKGPALPETLKLRLQGKVAILTLNRPAKRNALDDRTVKGIGKFFANPPAETGAVVLAGAGEHFSAGLDLSDLRDASVAEGMHHSRGWHEAFDRIQFGRVPVIAVLHGAVIGAGLELAASAHLRVAESSTFFALPEGQRGIFVGGSGSVRLPRLMGVARMTDMMLTGRVLTAEEGHQAGLAQYLVAPDKGLALGIELARKVAENAPLTNFGVMHALPRIADSSHASGLLLESLMAAIAQGAPEAKARLEAFLAKKAAKVRPK